MSQPEMRPLEDLEDVTMAEQRLEALRAGQSRVLTLAEVERELGLEH
jgi:predicted DNA-binding protein